jgi:hypothetical protein
VIISLMAGVRPQHMSLFYQNIYFFGQSVQVHAYIYLYIYILWLIKMNRLTWSSLSCMPLDMGLYGRVPQTRPSVRIGPSTRDCSLRRMANLEGSSECAIWNWELGHSLLGIVLSVCVISIHIFRLGRTLSDLSFVLGRTPSD